LTPYEVPLNIDDAEFENFFETRFEGETKTYDNYFIVHTIAKDDSGKTWSVYWSNYTILDKKEISFKEVASPYRVQKVHLSNKAEYYGIFREVLASQDAINQAVLKVALMANTQKVFFQKNSVLDAAKFTRQVNRVNSVIEVKNIKGILVESLTKEVLDQYTIIDKALDRIQRVLGINDSFLGLAFASDSGRKVKLQQNASILALKYISTRIEQFYTLVGQDITNLAKQYMTGHQVFSVTDDIIGRKWVEMNKPITQFTGQYDEAGEPIFDFVYEEVIDPETEEPLVDREGNILFAPMPHADTEIAFSDVDIEIESVFYNDEDEKNQLMIETVLSGNIGNTLLQINPASFLQVASLAMKSMKTKYSPIIAQIIENAGAQLQQQQQVGFNAEQQPLSQELKLPQNTNE